MNVGVAGRDRRLEVVVSQLIAARQVLEVGIEAGPELGDRRHAVVGIPGVVVHLVALAGLVVHRHLQARPAVVDAALDVALVGRRPHRGHVGLGVEHRRRVGQRRPGRDPVGARELPEQIVERVVLEHDLDDVVDRRAGTPVVRSARIRHPVVYARTMGRPRGGGARRPGADQCAAERDHGAARAGAGQCLTCHRPLLTWGWWTACCPCLPGDIGPEAPARFVRSRYAARCPDAGRPREGDESLR